MSHAPLAEQERRIMHRLVRLFRLERNGRLERWPIGFVFALIARRGRCIDDMMALDAERRRSGATADGTLHDAARALGREIGDALQPAENRADRLRSDVKALRGEGSNSGMKGFSTGKILGRG
ncbi:MAG TPA: hypothetical protein VNG52_02630 [Stellaceae bacterium]|nr:hypothetical protein [Stellaceae bacterium]